MRTVDKKERKTAEKKELQIYIILPLLLSFFVAAQWNQAQAQSDREGTRRGRSSVQTGLHAKTEGFVYKKKLVNRFKVKILTCTEAVRALSPHFLFLWDTPASQHLSIKITHLSLQTHVLNRTCDKNITPFFRIFKQEVQPQVQALAQWVKSRGWTQTVDETWMSSAISSLSLNCLL